MATTYRLCGPDDLDLLTEQVVAWLAADRRPASPAQVRRGLAGLLGDGHQGHAWLIERDGRGVGYTVMTFGRSLPFGEPRAYVTALYLEPAAREKGIGRHAERFLHDVGTWLRVPVHCFETATEQKHAARLLRGVTGISTSIHDQTQAVA